MTGGVGRALEGAYERRQIKCGDERFRDGVDAFLEGFSRRKFGGGSAVATAKVHFGFLRSFHIRRIVGTIIVLGVGEHGWVDLLLGSVVSVTSSAKN